MSTETTFDWIEPLVQLATAGGFGALVWYLVVKHIPSIEERHQNERKEWLSYIKDRDDNYDEMYKLAIESVNDVKHKLEQLEIRINAKS